MEDEPLARIAIIGAGPIGLEAALYGRFLGYRVALFERESIAANVRQWGHVRMFSPFALNRSPLGLAALAAQDASYRPPADDELLTGTEYVERYLLPLAESDLLADCISDSTSVLFVGRNGPIKTDSQGVDRAECEFRILLRNQAGDEEIIEADIVLDASGVYGTANWLGHGGIPAVGELSVRSQIDTHVPDVLGSERQRYADKHTLVIGAGYSAATTVVNLGQLRTVAPETRVTWVTRRALSQDDGPIQRVKDDRLPERDRLAVEANRLVVAPDSGVTHWNSTSVTAIARDADRDVFRVQLGGKHGGLFDFDRVVANVGHRPDTSIYSELQVHQCYATEGPMKLAASLVQSGHVDCLDQTSAGPESLQNPEPDFYILGSKSYGRNSNFLLSVGFQQIRDVFTLIAERSDLNLYDNLKHLLS